uniref:Uncharacterized protein n=1 Tax=Salix viminalis TaxID=40686 RepID=A0A6N2LVK0_SALVM
MIIIVIENQMYSDAYHASASLFLQGMVSNCFGYHPLRMKKFKILRRYQQPPQIGSSLFLQLIRGKQPLSTVMLQWTILKYME